MKLLKKKISVSYFIQILFYLFVNILFILKYFSRTSTNSTVLLVLYIILFAGTLLFNNFSRKISEQSFKIAFWTIQIIMISIIIVLLIKINPYSVRVDRWSALTFFLDGLFNGNYPYGVHTHVSENNFPSPFPVWHFINIPFYLLGDVGIGLIFFLLLSAFTIQYFFSSYRKSFFFLFLLCVSPAYWWEVAVRSDSLSNGILVMCVILVYHAKKYTIGKKLILTAIISGIIASTRLSAILPIALFLFPSFLKISFNKKVYFILTVIGFVLLTFLPFILWDTESWIFFSRNPFMSQSSIGNPLLLLGMVVLGVFMSLKWKDINQFFNITSIFIFIFILSSQLSLIFTRGINESFFTDSLYDISYFSLVLPYCIAFLVNNNNPLTPSLSNS